MDKKMILVKEDGSQNCAPMYAVTRTPPVNGSANPAISFSTFI